MITRLVSILSVLALAFFSQPASAQVLYKSTMPDGKVVYGDTPEKGAVKVDKTRPDTSKKGITAATPQEVEAARRQPAERAVGAGAGDRVTELEAQLRQREADREKEREPREGERIGTAGGGGRFTDSYLERQKLYDQQTDTLRKEIEKARAER